VNARWAVLACGLLACAGSGAPAAAPPVPAGWRLVFADDFDRFDDSRWEISTRTVDGSAGRFAPEGVSVRNGVLTLTASVQPTGDRAYDAAEIRSREPIGTFTYGRFEVRMRAARGSGLLSSFLAYRPVPWDEIDLEFLGRRPTAVEANLDVSPTETPQEVAAFPRLHDLSFDASAAFHVYAFEWDPTEVRWYVDGALIDRSNNPGAIPSLPLRLALKLWPSTDSSRAGPIDASRWPAHARYGWVRVYARVR